MRIPIDVSQRSIYFDLLNEAFDSGFLSEGVMLSRFEGLFKEKTGLISAAVHSGGAGLLALYEYCNVNGYDVVLPANTFWATAAAAKALMPIKTVSVCLLL